MIDFSGNTGGGGGGTVINKIVSTSAATTPLGVTWTSGSETITGTLAASAAIKDNIYYVPGKKTKTGNIYTEYSCLLSDGSYVWEQTGNADLNLDGYVQKGSNVLSQGHLLVTDSGGNVADSGKTTADLQDVIYGYLHEGTFYVESAHTTAITPSTTKQYVDMTTATAPAPYMWNGTSYIGIGGGGMTDDEKLIDASALTDLDERMVSVENGWELRNGVVFRSITTKEVVDNRTSPFTTFPLSAKQGYIIKQEADANEDTLAAGLCDLAFDRLPATVIADAYNAYSTYAVGAYCVENNTLFRCIAAVEAAEFFDAQKWAQTTVMAELVSLLNS